MGLFNKKELKRISELEEQINILNSTIEKTGAKEYAEVLKMIEDQKKNYEIKTAELQRSIEQIEHQKEKEQKDLDELKSKISEARKELFDISDEAMMESFGLYKPKYDCMNSAEYAEKIKSVRQQQKDKIKEKTALNYYDGWVLDNSKSKGRAMNNDNMKMVLRAFNNECDVLIDKVKFNSIDKIKEQIQKCASSIDKLNQRNRISIKQSYIDLKIEELELVHEFRMKKQEEKEAMQAARAEEREQAKLQKEIEEARKKVLKEQTHYQNAKEKYFAQLESASDEEKTLLLEKINEVDQKLQEIEKNLQDIDYRESNQKAGYVYVISNIGSFGENIYKIGMTRRLDPQDRIDELGDASVPFTFDVHAMIFSDDAPKLEAELHKAFEDKKVNMVNGRKEFFNVTLEEIEKVIKEHHDKLIEIKKVPDAEQFRETKLIKESIQHS